MIISGIRVRLPRACIREGEVECLEWDGQVVVMGGGRCGEGVAESEVGGTESGAGGRKRKNTVFAGAAFE
jgi:hypothetical protein